VHARSRHALYVVGFKCYYIDIKMFLFSFLVSSVLCVCVAVSRLWFARTTTPVFNDKQQYCRTTELWRAQTAGSFSKVAAFCTHAHIGFICVADKKRMINGCRRHRNGLDATASQSSPDMHHICTVEPERLLK